MSKIGRTIVLRNAAKLVGGVPALADRLVVLPSAVDGWLIGGVIPETIYLRVADIIRNHQNIEVGGTVTPLPE